MIDARIETVVVWLPPWSFDELQQHEVKPQCPFRPQALLLWGTSPKTFVRDIRIGHDPQLLARMPGHLFEPELGVEAFKRLLRDRPDGHATVIDPKAIGHVFEFDMITAELGAAIVVETTGPFFAGAFLGTMPAFEVETTGIDVDRFRPEPLPIPGSVAFDFDVEQPFELQLRRRS